MSKKSALEAMAGYYWNVMQRAPLDMPVDEYRDELDAVATVTDSPVLKAMCERNMNRFDYYRRPARAVAR